jgi:hypothetical protein
MTPSQITCVLDRDAEGYTRASTAEHLGVSTRTLARHCGPRRRVTLADRVLATLRMRRPWSAGAWITAGGIADELERDPRAVRRALRELGDRVESRHRRHPVGNHVRTVVEWRAR